MTDAASSRARRSPSPKTVRSLQQKHREAQTVAEQLYRQKPDWVTFFREVLGVDGVVSRLFPVPEERAAFEQSPEYGEIQRMLSELRSQGLWRPEVDDKEPTRVITVRLPKSMHEALRAEANSRQISMNKLCISKLIRALDALEEAEGEGSQDAQNDA